MNIFSGSDIVDNYKLINAITLKMYKNVIHENSERLLILIPITVKYLKSIMLQIDAYDSKITKILIKNQIFDFLN